MPPDDPRPRRRNARRLLLAAVVLLFVVAVLIVLAIRTPGLAPSAPPPTMRPSVTPAVARSVSIDFGMVTDRETDWREVDRRLDQVGATTVGLNAGRVEFTAFDWSAHPDVAAEPGTDHLAVAARALHETTDGRLREVNLIVDAFVPEWIKADASVAGVSATGRRAPHAASASQLAEGPVGQRLIDYVAALGERYNPNRIELTELFLSTYSFGDDDRALFLRMTGADDWPRTAKGAIDTESPAIGAWRSQVIAGFLTRVRQALNGVRGGEGRDIGLALDVRVDWDDPPAGRPLSGHDYRTLLGSGVALQAWVYLGLSDKRPEDIRQFTAALAAAGFDMSRVTLSVGLWRAKTTDDARQQITPDEFAAAVTAAESHGVTHVNVTPFTLFTDAHWTALAGAWA